LGGGSTSAAPDPISNDVEHAAQTTGLMRINTSNLSALLVDDSHLYLSSNPSDESGDSSLQRTNKTESWRNVDTIASQGVLLSATALSVGKLGWVNYKGLQMCDAPNCSDIQVVDSVTVDASYSEPIAWDATNVYWPLLSDHAIYRCDLPRCQLGPQLVATNAGPLSLAVVQEYLYWHDATYGILRTPLDGSAQPEQLTLGEATAWVSRSLSTGVTQSPCIHHVAIDGPFVYASLMVEPDCTPIASSDSVSLVRWKYAEPGAARETVLNNDTSLYEAAYMLVFDAEVVWATIGGDLWSCRAEQCAATKRQLGVKAYIDFAMNYRNGPIAADDQYLYWFSGECYNPGPESEACNLKRTPRIAR
jgi:hypothetical protein